MGWAFAIVGSASAVALVLGPGTRPLGAGLLGFAWLFTGSALGWTSAADGARGRLAAGIAVVLAAALGAGLLVVAASGDGTPWIVGGGRRNDNLDALEVVDGATRLSLVVRSWLAGLALGGAAGLVLAVWERRGASHRD